MLHVVFNYISNDWGIGLENLISSCYRCNFARKRGEFVVLIRETPSGAVLGIGEERRSRWEMRDVVVVDEDCVRVLGPGPEVRAYEEG